MAKILDMPKLSPTMEEGVLAAWSKKEGDAVAIDDILAEVETDKATMEFRSFDKGTLLKILVEPGTTIKLGQPVAILGEPGEDISALLAKAGASGGKDAAPAEAKEAAPEKDAAPGDDAEGEESEEKSDDEETPAEGDEAAAKEGDETAAKEGASKEKSAKATPSKQAAGQGDKPAAKATAKPAPSKEAAPAGKAASGKEEQGGEGSTKQAPAKSAAAKPAAAKGASSDKDAAAKDAGAAKSSGPQAGAAGGEGERIKASPYVRQVARERGIDLTQVDGSGPNGRVIARDLEGLEGSEGHDESDHENDEGHDETQTEGAENEGEEAAPEQAAAKSGKEGKSAEKPADRASAKTAEKSPSATTKAPAAAASRDGGPEIRPLSMMRKTIARRLTESKTTVPHFYLTIDVDAGELVKLREQINADLVAAAPKGQDPEKVSLNDLIVKACAIGLVRVPECNARFTPEAIQVFHRVDISVAVSIADGLVTPVVRDADKLSVLGISRSVRDLAGRAKAKKLAPEEMSDGTFSISNLGMFGIDSFSAVINPPEGAILAVGQVRDEPVVRDGQVVAGKRMSMTLSCDHRVIDGAVGARFLAALRALLERPMQILVG